MRCVFLIVRHVWWMKRSREARKTWTKLVSEFIQSVNPLSFAPTYLNSIGGFLIIQLLWITTENWRKILQVYSWPSRTKNDDALQNTSQFSHFVESTKDKLLYEWSNNSTPQWYPYLSLYWTDGPKSWGTKTSFKFAVNVTIFVSSTFDLFDRYFHGQNKYPTHFVCQSVRHYWHNVKLWRTLPVNRTQDTLIILKITVKKQQTDSSQPNNFTQ